MPGVQSFRVAGKTSDIKKIDADNVSGEDVVFWVDIEQLFPPGVAYIYNNGSLVKFLKGSDHTILEPRRIKYCPDVILEVHLSNTALTVTAGKGSDILVDGDCHVAKHHKHTATPNKLDKIIDQGKAIIGQNHAIFDQVVMTHQIAEKVFELQKKMNDHLNLIQRKVEAILTQNFELHEYTIPRLFIVLPETTISRDSTAVFSNNFRLRFICECGDHTKPAESSNAPAISHDLHVVGHDGYLVRKPTELFKKCGPFLTVMLEMIKQGTSLAGSIVPTIATIDKVTSQAIDYSLKQLEQIRAIEKLDGINTDEDAKAAREDLANYLANAEAVEGADLRQLRSYLEADSSDNLLGNLYRMFAADGHVKWVCRDHYRIGYREAYTQKLRDVIKLADGKFDEHLGRIEIFLGSSLAAAGFFSAISNARGVVELALTLGGKFSKSDLEKLERVLRKLRISILRLDLLGFQMGLLDNTLSTTASRYDILFRITELPELKRIHYLLPTDITRLPDFQTTSHCKLSFDMKPGSLGEHAFQLFAEKLKTSSTLTKLDLSGNLPGLKSVQALANALKTNDTLNSLYLFGSSIKDDGAQALAEALKINRALASLDLTKNLIERNGAQALAEALKTNNSLTALYLNGNSVGDDGAQALAEALETNEVLTTLGFILCSIGDDGLQALAKALKINSTLTALNLFGNSIGDDGAQALAEALRTNGTLTILYLTGNVIGDYGAQALAEALKINSTLVALYLTGSSIRDNGDQDLVEALHFELDITDRILRRKSNGNIIPLALARTSMFFRMNAAIYLGYGYDFDKIHRTLAEMLIRPSRNFFLTRNAIGDSGTQALTDALKINKTVAIMK